MFGLMRPHFKRMLRRERQEYSCYYCGLCMGMGRNTGKLSRMLINFDVCLAYLVADSISPDTEIKTGRCPYSLRRKVRYRDNPELLDKMSAINYILTYHKFLDDIDDDNSMLAKLMEKGMRKRYVDMERQHRRTAEAVASGMRSVREMERGNGRISIRDSAMPFGSLLENAMSDCLDDPTDAKVFATLCRYLGMWIYVVDACVDLERDCKHGKYNPIKAGYETGVGEILAERKEEIASFLSGCERSMHQLLQLFSSARNEQLIIELFSGLLPAKVEEMLK